MIRIILESTLKQIDVSMRKLALEGELRPNTVTELTNGKVKRIDFETLDKIVDGLNRIAIKREMQRRFTLDDVIMYEFVEDRIEDSNYDKDTGLYNTGLIDADRMGKNKEIGD